MDQVKKLLKISGILKCCMGVLLLELPFYSIFLVACGIALYLMSKSNDEVIYRYNILFLLIGIFGIFDLAGSVILFVVFDKVQRCKAHLINAPPKVVFQRSPEQRRMDSLLKLGVGMVFVAGLLFATTSWDIISNPLKIIALCFFGVLFLGLSFFSENKLKLYRSAHLYWLLSMAFFILTIVGILYFKVFSDVICYDGYGSCLAYAVTYFTIAGFSLITYLKHPKQIYLYITYAMVLLTGKAIFDHFDVSSLGVLCTYSIITVLFSIIYRKNDNVNFFLILFSFVLFTLMILVDNTSDLLYIIVGAIQIGLFQYLLIKDNRRIESILFVVATYLLLLLLSFRVDLFVNVNYLIAGLSISIYTLLLLGDILHVSKIYYNFILGTYIFFMTIYIYSSYASYNIIILSLISLMVIEVFKYGLFGVEKISISKYIDAFVLFNVIYSFINILSLKIFNFDQEEILLYSLSVCSLLFTIIHKFTKDIASRGTYFYGIIAIGSLGMLVNTEYLNIISSIPIIISGLYLFAISYLDKEEVKSKLKICFSYIYLLSSLFFPYVFSNILNFNGYVMSIMFIVLTFTIVFVLKDEFITKISYFFLILPICNIIRLSEFNYVWQEISINALLLFIVLLVLKFYVKMPLIQNIVYISTISIISLQLIIIDEIAANIFIGIIGLASLIYSILKEKYYPIFIASIIISVINILHALKDVWGSLPFWFYLLIGGLIIIGFVTFIEMKKINKKSN